MCPSIAYTWNVPGSAATMLLRLCRSAYKGKESAVLFDLSHYNIKFTELPLQKNKIT